MWWMGRTSCGVTTSSVCGFAGTGTWGSARCVLRVGIPAGVAEVYLAFVVAEKGFEVVGELQADVERGVGVGVIVGEVCVYFGSVGFEGVFADVGGGAVFAGVFAHVPEQVLIGGVEAYDPVSFVGVDVKYTGVGCVVGNVGVFVVGVESG
jgi:hypothetical protein